MSFFKRMFGKTEKAFKSRAPSVRNPTSFFTGRSTPTTRALNRPKISTNLSRAQAVNNRNVLANRSSEAEYKHEMLEHNRIMKNTLKTLSEIFGVNIKSPENYIKHMNKLQDKIAEIDKAEQEAMKNINEMQRLMLGNPPQALPGAPPPALPRLVFNSSDFTLPNMPHPTLEYLKTHPPTNEEMLVLRGMKPPPQGQPQFTNKEMLVLLGMKQPSVSNNNFALAGMKPPQRNNTKNPAGMPAARKTRRRY